MRVVPVLRKVRRLFCKFSYDEQRRKVSPALA